MTKTDTYTIADLQAMPDDALSALAAELRGWQFSIAGILQDKNGQEVRQRDCVVFKLGTASESYPYFWSPATDRNQSGELLEWAASQGFRISIGRDETGIHVGIYSDRGRFGAHDEKWPRAETIAFIAAMLDLKGRLTE